MKPNQAWALSATAHTLSVTRPVVGKVRQSIPKALQPEVHCPRRQLQHQGFTVSRKPWSLCCTCQRASTAFSVKACTDLENVSGTQVYHVHNSCQHLRDTVAVTGADAMNKAKLNADEFAKHVVTKLVATPALYTMIPSACIAPSGSIAIPLTNLVNSLTYEDDTTSTSPPSATGPRLRRCGAPIKRWPVP